ncbi:c-type cytochrome biogenesis protein CcmI [Achromobacter dolens]|uniref:c-type cytochrome biogenesis protein CcmI n=1 Tax=Achromobacter dolens TaxID=1287738 RepID=UPI00300CB356
MTLFWLLAAGMVAVALLFVLPPLLAPEAAGRRGGSPQAQASLAVLREQLAQLQADHASGRIAPDHYAQARAEIERRALREGCAAPDRLDTRPAPRWALAVTLGLGAISVGLYAALGDPAALTPADADPHASPSASAGHDPGDPMAERLAGLIQHLQAHPDDTEGWMTLAHTYATLGDFAGGAATWARMGARAPQDPGVLADWADLLATAADGDFSGEPDRLIGRLLALAPDDVKGLALAGTSAFFRGDFHGAIDAWERLLPLVDPDGPVHEQIQASLAQARRAAEGAAADGGAADGGATDGAATDGGAADRTAADRAAAGAEGPAFPPGARASGGRGRQD